MGWQILRQLWFGTCVAALELVFAASAALADVVISTAATQNIDCSGGACVPTATDAVLNVSDLENLLTSGNVEVMTTGTGIQANNIDVDAALTWSGASALSLVAYNAITVSQKITVAGPGGLSLSTPNNTLYSFAGKGRVEFQNLTSQLSINGTAFMLISDITSLASAIANNPSGAYALADNYNASAEGKYTASPIQTPLTGTFDGLGNAISRLSIQYKSRTPTYIGFFEFNTGTIRDLNLLDCRIYVTKSKPVGGIVGSIASFNGGLLFRVSASGTIQDEATLVGGLAGANQGSIINSSSLIDVESGKVPSTVGDIAGENAGGVAQITTSFVTGNTSSLGRNSIIGDIVGVNLGFIQNVYATGGVKGGDHSRVGGFVGVNSGAEGQGALIYTSYSTGAVSAGKNGLVGGYAGNVYPPSKRFNHHVYWDTDTSGTDQGTGRGNKNGITGLNSAELQSGLPNGFDPTIWAQNPKINNGFPYLIANPPPK